MSISDNPAGQRGIKEASTTPKGKAARDRIYAASIGLMSRLGFDAITVPAICKAAGISVGAFYHHFSSKNDILVAFVRDESQVILDYYRTLGSLRRIDALMASLEMFFGMFEFKGSRFVSAFLALSIADPVSYFDLREFSIVSILEDSVRAAFELGELKSFMPAESVICFVRGTLLDIVISWSLGLETENPKHLCRERLGLLWSLVTGDSFGIDTSKRDRL